MTKREHFKTIHGSLKGELGGSEKRRNTLDDVVKGSSPPWRFCSEVSAGLRPLQLATWQTYIYSTFSWLDSKQQIIFRHVTDWVLATASWIEFRNTDSVMSRRRSRYSCNSPIPAHFPVKQQFHFLFSKHQKKSAGRLILMGLMPGQQSRRGSVCRNAPNMLK